MIKYISLLRGINVSGQKKIKMDDLRSVYDSLDFKNVISYIQSGNVVFCSSINRTKEIEQKIEKEIEKIYNFHVPVIVLTQRKLKEIISNNPFNGKDIALSKLCVIFLNSVPNKSLVENVISLNSNNEKFIILDNVIYLYCPDGFGRVKFGNNFFESKLKVTATTRNWKTTNKLFKIADEINCGK